MAFADFIKSKLAPGEIALLSVELAGSTVKSVSCATLSKEEKGEVKLSDVSSPLPEELNKQEFVKSKMPVLVCFYGSGVLVKNVAATEKNPIKSVLHSANENDFHLQQTSAGEGSSLVSVVRKDVVNEVLKSWGDELSSLVVGIAAGPCALTYVWDAFQLSESIGTQNFQLEKSGSHFIINKGENTSGVASSYQGIPSDFLPAYALGLLYFKLGTPEQFLIVDEDMKLNHDELQNRQKFRMGLYVAMGFLIVLLLANFLVFDHYNSEVANLQANVDQVKTQSQKLKKDQELKEKKIRFIKETGTMFSSRKSLYADRIGKSVPKNIQLVQLQIFPLEKKVKEDKQTQYTKNLIRISGVCKKVKEFQTWTSELRKLDFTKEVNVIDYFNDEQNRGNFEIEIDLN